MLRAPVLVLATFAGVFPARAVWLHAPEAPDYSHPPWLRNCSRIYLDVGSNIGVQVRKLYEPAKYTGAAVLHQFTKVFGDLALRRTTVCALGIEPNPNQQPRLQALEAAYNTRGFRTHFYPYAAWSEEGTMTFRTDMRNFSESRDNNNDAHEEWGAHLPTKGSNEVEVRTISLNLR